MNAPMLVDFQMNGTTTKGLLKPARNGYLYWLKRDTDGSISYLRSQPFVPQNVFTSIDKETGRPEVDMAHKPGTGKSAQFCPAFGVARTGRTRPTIPRLVLFTFRPMKITATRSKAKSKIAFRGSGGLASPSRTFTFPSTRRQRSLASSRP